MENTYTIVDKYSLDSKYNNPIITLDWFIGCRALIDTGASLPIWLQEKDTVLKIKGGRRINNETVKLNGINGGIQVPLYRVNFDMGSLHFQDMPIAVRKIDVDNAHIILPATLFEGMVYEIDNINHVFTVKTNSTKEFYRKLKIKDKNGIPSIYLADTYSTK